MLLTPLTDRFRDLIKSALSESIKNSVQAHEPSNVRQNAVGVVDFLTGTDAKGMIPSCTFSVSCGLISSSSDGFHDIIAPSIPLLLKIALTDGDDEDFRDSIKHILFSNLAASDKESG
jgi:hypothetical protein